MSLSLRMPPFANIWAAFEEFDRTMFRKINADWSNSVFDVFFPWLRLSSVWAPLYIFILAFVIVNLGKNAGWWILFFVVTVAMTDMIGTYVFKHNVKRPRPCWDPLLIDYIQLRIKACAGGYSFTSNHAANHFGMATFFYLTLRHSYPRWAWIGFVWAALICYSQVYVGVHYPLDVVCGALLGLILGVFTASLFNKRFGITIFDKESIASS